MDFTFIVDILGFVTSILLLWIIFVWSRQIKDLTKENNKLYSALSRLYILHRVLHIDSYLSGMFEPLTDQIEKELGIEFDTYVESLDKYK